MIRIQERFSAGVIIPAQQTLAIMPPGPFDGPGCPLLRLYRLLWFPGFIFKFLEE
jgi:hypothetical protein